MRGRGGGGAERAGENGISTFLWYNTENSDPRADQHADQTTPRPPPVFILLLAAWVDLSRFYTRTFGSPCTSVSGGQLSITRMSSRYSPSSSPRALIVAGIVSNMTLRK
jgi:hypothetical protein